jgi:hypothetical protein
MTSTTTTDAEQIRWQRDTAATSQQADQPAIRAAARTLRRRSRRMARISGSFSTARNHPDWRGGAGRDTPTGAQLPASSTACIVVSW